MEWNVVWGYSWSVRELSEWIDEKKVKLVKLKNEEINSNESDVVSTIEIGICEICDTYGIYSGI